MTLQRSAIISPDGVYRYQLVRRFNPNRGQAMFLMLNPSVADANRDDHTLRRCMNLAARWGYGAVEVGNLFALRSTDPAVLRGHPDPVGPENNGYLVEMLGRSDIVIAGWGMEAAPFPQRIETVEKLCGPILQCLGHTKAGFPLHPSRVSKLALPEPYRLPSGASS